MRREKRERIVRRTASAGAAMCATMPAAGKVPPGAARKRGQKGALGKR